MRYFTKYAELGKMPKLPLWGKGMLLGLGILGAGYGLHKLTEKPKRVWMQ